MIHSVRVRLATFVTDAIVPVVFPRINWFFRWLLSSRLHWAASWYVVVIIVRGQRTGRIYRVPIAFHHDGPFTLESLTSPRGQWWKNLRGVSAVSVLYRGHVRPAAVELVEHDIEMKTRSLARRDFFRRLLTPLPPGRSILIRITLGEAREP